MTRCLEMSWNETKELAMDREEWRRCLNQCEDLYGKDTWPRWLRVSLLHYLLSISWSHDARFTP